MCVPEHMCVEMVCEHVLIPALCSHTEASIACISKGHIYQPLMLACTRLIGSGYSQQQSHQIVTPNTHICLSMNYTY